MLVLNFALNLQEQLIHVQLSQPLMGLVMELEPLLHQPHVQLIPQIAQPPQQPLILTLNAKLGDRPA